MNRLRLRRVRLDRTEPDNKFLYLKTSDAAIELGPKRSTCDKQESK
jgi:hypothetical protein